MLNSTWLKMPKRDNVLDSSGDYRYGGRNVISTIGGTIVLAASLLLLERMGSDSIAIFWTGTTGLWLLVALQSLRYASLEPRLCFVGSRQLGELQLGLANAHDLLGMIFVLFIMAAKLPMQMMFVGALVTGTVISGAGMAAYIRKSGAYNAVEFLGQFFNSNLLRLLTLLALSVAIFGALIFVVEFASSMLSFHTEIPTNIARIMVLVLAVLFAITSGIKNLNWVGAFVAVLVLTTLSLDPIYSGIIGGELFTSGSSIAISTSTITTNVLGLFPMMTPDMRIPDFDQPNTWSITALVLLFSMGLPLMTFRHASASKVRGARNSISVTLLVLALTLAFSLSLLLEVGSSIQRQTVAPNVLQNLTAVGLSLLMVSMASILLWSIALPLAHQGFKKLLLQKMSPDRTLFSARVIVILLAFMIWFFSDFLHPLVWDWMLLSFSLFCSAILVPVVAAIWWRRVNKWGAVAAVAIGAIVPFCIAMVKLKLADSSLPWTLELADLIAALGIPLLLIASIFAALVSLMVVSLITPPPTLSQLDWQRQLRRPGGDILIRENW